MFQILQLHFIGQGMSNIYEDGIAFPSGFIIFRFL